MSDIKAPGATYLITGIAGAGKTTVSELLATRGYNVIELDGAPSENIRLISDLRKKFDKRSGEPSDFVRGNGWDELQHVEWKVDRKKLLEQLSDGKPGINFVSGYANNWNEFKDDFDGIFLLTINQATIEQRLLSRVNGDWGRKHPEELKHAVDTAEEFNASIIELGAVAIDANQPTDDIASQIMSHVGPTLKAAQ